VLHVLLGLLIRCVCPAICIRYAGIGGLSELLGWTEVQQDENRGQFMGGVENIFKLVALVLAADVALFAYEQIMFMKGTPMQ
jgi:hypothetical protein